ncbi:succinylglutamate desuccinylase/aspartoacylase family protein [Ferrovibrio sp.]|uniref:succinylglutamate desuccinylase/aspartoacylase domain-containing protein n=1 Tax=Ferrovibrio sp. TaxID=1917215 RepID=UPI001B521AA5|nr:succinylglutamate desuccinylase/aspartoacylase family protein [Ferrovibrio sp.]MBP7066160.1 succinylglutamate desuccinylase/aspartoacylase family protein [Ferrovibrio sp.]
MTSPSDNLPPIEITPKDLSAYRSGNRGVDYVHTFDSGRPGPHVIVNALTHGNEFCGMIAVTHLLEQSIRPVRGKLTLSFANVAAYHRFDPARPFESRFVDRDFNRIWDDATLDGPDQSVEAIRARELRPIFAEGDALLDIHSTSHAVPPMLIHEPQAKYAALSRHLHSPLHHVLLPGVMHPGRPLIQFGAYGRPDAAPLGVVVECGQHFAASSGILAISITMRFLDFFGMIPADLAAQYQPEAGEPKRYEVTRVVVAQSADFRFAQPWIGFEELAEGELIAMDGDIEVRAPFPRCTIIMPTRRIQQGRDVVSLARPV